MTQVRESIRRESIWRVSQATIFRFARMPLCPPSFTQLDQARHQLPIMRPMAGILIDAVRCFQNNFEARHPSRRQEFREARLWIFDDRGTGPFSFRSVCDSLEVDPRGLRNWIVRWQERRRSGERQRMIRRSPVNIAKRMHSRRGNHYGEAIEAMHRG
jgi:hypothetical protein